MIELLPCEFRGEPFLTKTGRTKYPCSHPKVVAGGDGTTSAAACEECPWATWLPEKMIAGYNPTDSRVSKEVYAARLTICDGCTEGRSGDYCEIACGCRLSSKCNRPAFVCPLGKHAGVKDENT